MSVLLTILKILGIILLVIIGLALFLFLMVLFLPVRYRMHGEYEEDFHLEAKAGWLCRLLYFHFKMDNKEKIGILRICGIPIMQFPPDEEKERRKKEKKSKKRRKGSGRKAKAKKKSRKSQVKLADKQNNQKTEEKQQEKNRLEQQQSATQLLEDKDSKISNPILAEEESDSWNNKKDNTKDDSAKESDKKKKQTEEKTSFLKRVKQFWDKLRKRLIQLPEKLKDIFSKIDDIKMLWMDENNKKSTSLILAEVRYLLLHYGPTKIHADIQFSTGDPANTGKVLGILSLIPFLYQKDVHVVPDFVSEKLYLQGYMNAKGHIRILHLIRMLLHCYKDKNLTTWIKDNL